MLDQISNDVAEIRRLLDEQFRTALDASRQVTIGGEVRDSVVITGDRNTVFIQHVIAPIRRLPIDYTTRIKSFRDNYLGTPQHPVTFGGREEVLRQLDNWLADPTTPYLLLTAPAGRGKSALLAQWLAQLCSSLPIVFVPISIRFSTNSASVAFASLAEQLARSFNEEILTDANTPYEVWRGICSRYLQRQPPQGRLLVVLDGVDEAADWDADGALFPLNPPPGLKVIVSARLTAHRSEAKDWLRALVWDRLNVDCLMLDPLDKTGLSDVLKKMNRSLDQLAHQPFIDELYRLTGGEPLLVRLYVEDLWQCSTHASRLTAEDLSTIKPGYKGYMDRWFEDQRKLWGDDTPLKERSVRETLNLLATALGPLQADDLLSLADRSAIEDSWMLDQALYPLERFVIATNDGYVFSHPKLGDYFFENLTNSERQALEQRFLQWCKCVFDNLHKESLAPQQAPPYVVRFYRAHLQRANTPLSNLRHLAESQAWAATWEAYEGGYNGYLSDIAAVWQRAAAENRLAAEAHQPKPTPHLGLEIRCALIESTIRALVYNLPPNLPKLLVQHGIWSVTQAMSYVRQMLDGHQQATTLRTLAPHLSLELLHDALVAARKIKEELFRADALAALAPHLPKGLLPDALTAACEIKKEPFRTEALTALVPYLPETERHAVLTDALAAACKIADEKYRAEAIIALAPHLPETERHAVLTDALAAACKIPEKSFRTKVLAELAPHLPETERHAVLLKALAVTRKIADKKTRAEMLAALAPHLSGKDRYAVLTEALAAAREIAEDWLRVKGIAALAPHLPETERYAVLTEALAAARKIDEQKYWFRAEALAALVPYLPETERHAVLTEALAATRKIAEGKDRAEILTALAPHLSEKERYAVLTEALAATRKIAEGKDRAEILTALAPHLSEKERYAVLTDALAAACKIAEGKDRAEMLAALAPHLSGKDRYAVLTEALAAAREIAEDWLRVKGIAALAPHLPETERYAVLTEALDTARKIADKKARAEALAALASHLPETERHAVLTEALDAARKIKDDQSRALALVALAPHLPPKLRAEALAAARAIDWKDFRTWALAMLAPHLTPELRAEALAAARAINWKPYRVEAIAALVPYLPETERHDVLTEALATDPAIYNDLSSKMLATLAPHLAALPAPLRYRCLTETLPLLARRPRPELLACLHALLPLITATGGAKAAGEMFHALRDVAQWWP
ncbi:AAA family ATPase [Chloroflexus islandicus]|uniref:AAA family ATPase n=1 Tax=Chloroflexus islandicus TaxID=1707952 RepID=UPI00155F5C23|nr:AAA family ATPase [Chloroflexus islandicus]